MNEKNPKTEKRGTARRASKECAYLAAIVAVILLSQLLLSALPTVEIVTLLFVVYAFTFGVRRGMLAATAFSILRQLVYGVYPSVFFVYLLYYNLLTATFGWIGRRVKKPLAALWWLLLLAVAFTALFTMLDNVVTPLWYGYDCRAMQAYFLASIPFMIPQLVCTAVTVGLLFLPLERAFRLAKRGLR